MRTKFDESPLLLKLRLCLPANSLNLFSEKRYTQKIVIEGLKEGRLTGIIPGFLSMNLPVFVNISCS